MKLIEKALAKIPRRLKYLIIAIEITSIIAILIFYHDLLWKSFLETYRFL